MGGLIESAGQQTGADTGHHIYPQPNFAAIEGSLSDDALGTVAGVGQQHVVGLVGDVAEEVALDDRCGSLQLLLLQLLVDLHSRGRVNR